MQLRRLLMSATTANNYRAGAHCARARGAKFLQREYKRSHEQQQQYDP